MFESALLQTQPRRGLISIGWIIEALLMALLVLMPLLRVQDLPQALPSEVLFAPPPPMGAPKVPRASPTPRTAHQSMPVPTFIPSVIISPAVRQEAATQAAAPDLAYSVPWGARQRRSERHRYRQPPSTSGPGSNVEASRGAGTSWRPGGRSQTDLPGEA